MLSDAHCHFDEERNLAAMQKKHHIPAIINCDSPEEWQKNNIWIDPDIHTLSFGIHPWKTNLYTTEQVMPYLEKAEIIGEIGLDSVWTDVPLSQQIDQLERQLAYAHTAQKPVVLHVKGCEKTLLPLLRRYPNRFLIHWYSCLAHQEAYIDLDCYFTIGVDVATNPAVQALAKKVPAHRLLLETDGLDAVEWAFDRAVMLAEYPAILQKSVQKIAQLRQEEPRYIEKITFQNLTNYLKRAPS